jgi:hypothetical protein
MKTNSGAAMARERTDFMIQFLNQLASELGVDIAEVDAAIRKHCERPTT